MSRDSIAIAFLGDIFLGDHPSVSLTPEVATVLRDADLVVGNLEAPITVSGEFTEGKCCLKQSPQAVDTLRAWGVEVLSLANNHILDYGGEGLEHTRVALDGIGVFYLGSGHDLADATRPLVLKVKDMVVGFLAYSCERAQTTCATEDSLGCAPLDGDLMRRDVHALADQVDVVIVMPHWGRCDYVYPMPDQLTLAGSLSKAGATAIVGHHSHVLQGISQGISQGTDFLVAYSIGNFVFAPHMHRGRMATLTKDNRRGAILTLHLQPGKVASHDLTFTSFHHNTVRLDDSRGRQRVFEKRCAGLLSADYDKFWNGYVRRRLLRRFLHWVNPLNWRKVRREHLGGLWAMLTQLRTRKRQ